MILTQRKKCPNPQCMWIGATDSYSCPSCGTSLMSAASNSAKHTTTIAIIDKNGNYKRLVD